MDLTSTLARFVNSKVRKRGQHYFRGGRVDLAACDSEKVEAEVTGSSQYAVHLTRDAQALRASCTCPFGHRAEACKHIWAVILAADAKGGLMGSGGNPPNRLVVEATAKNAAPSVRARQERARPKPQPTRRIQAAPPPPAWRKVMDQLDRTSVPLAPYPAGSILYVIDLPGTLKTQQLALELLTGRKKRDGSWGKLYRLNLNRGDIPSLPDPADRKILSLIAGASLGGVWTNWYYPGVSHIPSPCTVQGEAASLLLPLLCDTGRCRMGAGPEAEAEPLAWNEEHPWELWLEVREDEGGNCVVAGSLRSGEERLAPGQTAFLLPGGCLYIDGQISRLTPDDARRWFPLLRENGVLRVPAADREELLRRLLASPGLPRLDLPESMRFEETRPTPRPRLRLLPAKGLPNEWPRAELAFLYGDQEVAADAPGRGLYQAEERRLLLRDLETERLSADRLLELGFRPGAHAVGRKPSLQIPTTRVPKTVRALLAEGWSVEAEGKLHRAAGSFRLGVASGVDWFELHGDVEFEGETVRLPELLAALRRGEGFIPLSDGSLGVLPEEWLKKLAPMARLGQEEGGHLRFRPAQAALLDAWLADDPQATWDETFEHARQRLRGFSGIAPAEAPPGFHGDLRGYQRAGLGWLHFLRDFGFGGCLADDMGLGKTVQVLALLEARRELRAEEGLPPSLVVVPRSLIFNWLAEAAHFTPELRVLDHTGIGRAREGEPFAGCDLVLTTYGTLRRDVAA